MTEAEQRSFITRCILSCRAGRGERREQALRDVLSISIPELGAADAQQIASLVPELPPSLYQKWADMFADRLLETVPDKQVAELCLDTEESNATLRAVYAMFMESERMEKVVAEDLQKLNAASSHTSQTDSTAALIAAWLRARISSKSEP